MSRAGRTGDSPSYSVVMYSDDILGLGHVRRNTLIASRLVQTLPGTRVLLLTGLPSGCFFSMPHGVDFIKLPSIRKIATGRYGPRTLPVGQQDLKRLRTTVITEVTRAFRPDLFLVDHMPAGVFRELVPALRDLRVGQHPTRTVLGLRDILDEPEVTQRLWQEHGVYGVIDELYDAVLIYGCEEVFDTRFHYHLDRRVSTPVEYCGYLTSDPAPPGTRRAVLEPHGDDERLVVITAGGGADGFPMMQSCLQALRRLQGQHGLRVVIITGPFMSGEQRDELRDSVAGLPARVLWCVEDGPAWLAAADLVIAMAGYNTVMEAIRLQRRLIVVPRPGPSAEQRIRAQTLARRGLLRIAETEAPESLARQIDVCLCSASPQTKLPSMNGLDAAVGRLRELLQQTEVPTTVAAGARG